MIEPFPSYSVFTAPHIPLFLPLSQPATKSLSPWPPTGLLSRLTMTLLSPTDVPLSCCLSPHLLCGSCPPVTPNLWRPSGPYSCFLGHLTHSHDHGFLQHADHSQIQILRLCQESPRSPHHQRFTRMHNTQCKLCLQLRFITETQGG